MGLKSLASAAPDSGITVLMTLWGKAIGGAFSGRIGTGIGLLPCPRIFTPLNGDVDEGGEVKKNTLEMSRILSPVILGTSLGILRSAH